MYEEIFNQIRFAANKRNLKDSTIHAYFTRNIQSLPFRNPLLLQKSIEDELGCVVVKRFCNACG